MTRRRAGAAALAALCCCAVLATRPTVAAAAGADPGALPPIGQTTAAVRQDGCVKPSDKVVDRTPWAQALLRPETAWQLHRGAGVTVAVVGSGVDGASGVLGNRLAPGTRLHGPGGADRDCVGHGTFLAGLIAARQQDGTGFAGIAPEARILPVAVTDDTGATSADLLARGIRAAADGGARVIAVAVPVAAGGDDLAKAVRYAGDKGALVVAPAAPDPGVAPAGTTVGEVFPAAYPDVLAVSDLAPGGTLPARGTGGTGGASGTGGSGGASGAGGSGGADGAPGSAARPAGRIDLVAPGTAMTGPGPGGKGHFTGSGPSYATAVVAGTAALVLGYRPELTRAQLLDRLKATAYHPGTALPDPWLGWGTVDPSAAVGAELPPPVAATARPAPTVAALAPPTPDPAGGQAALLAGGVLAGTALAGGAAAVLIRGRRRSWQPGRWNG
ncbi:S8 family serine peptidase [Kitasatospora sp. NPDC054939]